VGRIDGNGHRLATTQIDREVSGAVADHREGARGDPTPLWFGPDERPLFGWLHLPEGRTAHGGVVLCQPLGIEATCLYYTYRLLADRLCDLGLAVLRFDYDGTGDSAGGELDPNRLDAWLGSVHEGTDFLSATGVEAIGLVGVRMGGLFAAGEAARRGGVDALALWDPCTSGKSYLRQQRLLRQVSGGGEATPDGAIEAPGICFGRDTVAELSTLDIATMEGAFAKRILALVPPQTSAPQSLIRRLDGQSVDWEEATGQVELLDSNRQLPPAETIERVAAWMAGALSGIPVPVKVPSANTGVAVVGRTADGQDIREHTVRLGPLSLFGIMTESVEAGTSPTMVLVDEGNTHHIGQARIWVDLARHLTGRGFRMLRFDLSGNGDSGTRPGQKGHVGRAPEAFDDVWDAVQAISPADPSNVVLFGFCAGGYEALEQSLGHPPKGVCVINPSFGFTPPEPEGSHDRRARQMTKTWAVALARRPLGWATRKMAQDEAARWDRALVNGTWPMALATRRPDIPTKVWSFVNEHLLERTAIETLEQIVHSGVDTLLVTGPTDLAPMLLGSDRRLEVLRQSPNFQLTVLDELMHAAWVLNQRELLINVLSEYAADRFAAAADEPATSPPATTA
jgi:alpha-beta hydrolase superfamily lysophospholipase